MKNPGLSSFSAGATTFERPPNHPIWDEDPDYDPDDPDNDSDYMPPRGFDRWKTPGQSLRIPTIVGPKFHPEELPSDVIHGEVISPAEEDSADRILKDEHESDSPSENPYVENARQDLKTPGSAVAVDTLSNLLRGANPSSMSQSMDVAHDYLSRHFTGVKVNPQHGIMVVTSPAGSQMVKRETHLPAVREEEPLFSLTNKHGEFQSEDPKKLIRAMVAFQIVHNQIAQKDKEDKDKASNGITTSSGVMDFARGVYDWANERKSPVKVPDPPKPLEVPHSAVFEPGLGTDKGPGKNGGQGGYVVHMRDAPADSGWHFDPRTNMVYSPGHSMGNMLDPVKSIIPRDDPRFAGHQFTYSQNPALGYTNRRVAGNTDYWVKDVHPAVRGAGFDHPPAPRSTKPGAPGLTPGPTPAGHFPPKTRAPRRPPRTSSAQSNDLCPVCVSGYLEPYDSTYHECLNCGSLVKHVGFEKEAARPKGGLGRGLKQIQEYEGDPLGLASGGSENPDFVVPEGSFVHPLAGEENQTPEEEQYRAKKRLLDREAMVGTDAFKAKFFRMWPDNLTVEAAEADPIDEHMGKLGFRPLHKPGQSRAYIAHLPGTRGAFARLTEGVPHPETGERGWVLTADYAAPKREQWTMDGEPYRDRKINVDRLTKSPGSPQFRQPLPDLGDNTMTQKSILAAGTHPIEDASLNRAIRDVSENGRGSETYRKVFDTAYEPPAPLRPEPGMTQRNLRGLSSVKNPGLSRFITSTD